VTTSEFDDVKSRLASIENRHKVLDQRREQAEFAADLDHGWRQYRGQQD